MEWRGGRSSARRASLDHRRAGIELFRARPGWDPFSEVTFSEFGERGSIDIFAAHAAAQAVAVCEVKSVIGSLEETNRMLDVKERLAPTIAHRKLGWRPVVVGRLLILPRDSSVRRIVDSHASTMLSVYLGRGREVRAWLRNPNTPLRAIWFVSDGPNRTTVDP